MSRFNWNNIERIVWHLWMEWGQFANTLPTTANHRKQIIFFEFLWKKKARRTKYYKMINWLSSWNWCAYAVLKCSLLVITSQRSIHDKESKTLFHLHVAVALNIALYIYICAYGRHLMNFYATFGMQNYFIQIVGRFASNENSIHWCYSTRSLKHVLKFIANWIANGTNKIPAMANGIFANPTESVHHRWIEIARQCTKWNILLNLLKTIPNAILPSLRY